MYIYCSSMYNIYHVEGEQPFGVSSRHDDLERCQLILLDGELHCRSVLVEMVKEIAAYGEWKLVNGVRDVMINKQEYVDIT